MLLTFGTLFTAGAIVGVIAGSQNPRHANEAGREAGKKLGQTIGPFILIGGPFLALLLGMGIAIIGVHPGGRFFPSSEQPSNSESRKNLNET